MRLSKFIRANLGDIERAWEDFARTLRPFAADLSESVLRNDLRDILTAMADDMDTAQSSEEQQAKSKGHGPTGGTLDRISTIHAREWQAFAFGEAICRVLRLVSSRMVNS